MPCDTLPWFIDLRIDGDFGSEERISFQNITIAGGVIVGKVFDEPGEFMSVLRGTCTPADFTGNPDMVHLEFVFNVRDVRGGIFVLHLKGVGYLPPSGRFKEFRGEFRAFLPFAGGPFSFSGDPATVTGQLENLAFDEGDTGTGTGQQT